jgi:hypothetical protein
MLFRNGFLCITQSSLETKNACGGILSKGAQSKPVQRIFGDKRFATISAVEGLVLSPTSRRIEALEAKGLTPAQKREEVFRAYCGPKSR